MKNLILISIICFILSNDSFAQTNLDSNAIYINATQLLINDILLNQKFASKEFKKIIDARKLYIGPEIFHKLDSVYTKLDTSNFYVTTKLIRRFDILAKNKTVNDSDERFYASCRFYLYLHRSMGELLDDLMDKDLVKKEMLKKANPDAVYYKFLQQIKPKENSTIIDIGSGSGLLPLLLSKLDMPLNIYINELDITSFNIILNYIEPKSNGTTIKAIEGKKKSTNCENIEADVITAVNTVHHFKKKDKMMQSVKKSMNSNTRLLILENNKFRIGDATNAERERQCKLAMSDDELTQVFVKNNFKINEKKALSQHGLTLYELGI